MPGDIEQAVEQDLEVDFGPVNLLVAPHHGSKTSSSIEFINAVNAKTVLFPAGYLNRYHFPNQQVIQRYQDSGAIRYNTADHGAILIQLKQHKPQQLISWRQAARKIWTTVATD